MNYAKKDNKVYFVKSMDEVTLKDDKDLFIVKLDDLELHTFDEFERQPKLPFRPLLMRVCFG